MQHLRPGIQPGRHTKCHSTRTLSQQATNNPKFQKWEPKTKDIEEAYELRRQTLRYKEQIIQNKHIENINSAGNILARNAGKR